MRTGYNRFNHKDDKTLTPRQRQMIARRLYMVITGVAIALILILSIGQTSLDSKAADTYNKYYTSIAVKPGDTLSDYYRTYGERYDCAADYYQEVSMINDIDVDNIHAGMYLIVPYYSQEVK